MIDEFNEIILREKERSLHISRVPKNIKEEFVKFAEEEFAGDYGMLLRELWESYKRNKTLFEGMDIKLNYISQVLEQSTATKQEEEPGRKMLSGEVKGGKK